MRADWHIHSTASDGTARPAEIARLAAREGFDAIALTDHDTMDGVGECADACREVGLAFLPGVEISTGGDREVHLLGYGLDAERVAPRLRLVRGDREERMRAMVEKCRMAGLDVTEEDVREIAGGAPLGRPHLAMALVRRGYASSVKNAFDRYLGDGRPCCVPRGRMPLIEAIEAIHEAGGVAVIAHPVLIRCERRMLTQTLAAMLEMGVDGVECWHSAHTPSDAAELAAFARRRGALRTGGSDFHGANKPTRLGDGLASWADPRADWEALLEAVAKARRM